MIDHPFCNGALWFLLCLGVLKFFFGIFVRVCGTGKTKILAFSLMVIGLLGCIPSHALAYNISLPFALNALPCGLTFFSFGILLNELCFSVDLRAGISFLIMLFGYLLLFGLVSRYSFVCVDVGNGVYEPYLLPLSLIGIVSTWFAARILPRRLKSFVRWIGENSLFFFATESLCRSLVAVLLSLGGIQIVHPIWRQTCAFSDKCVYALVLLSSLPLVALGAKYVYNRIVCRCLRLEVAK